jgi:signal transduction histidine kinase
MVHEPPPAATGELVIRGPGPTPLAAAARVAAFTTLIAFGLYAAATAAILFIFTGLAIAAVDNQLQDRLHVRPPMQRGEPLDRGLSREGTYGPLYQWIIDPSGNVAVASPNAPELPASYRYVAGPATVTLGAESVRLVGGPTRGGYLVVGESLEFLAEGQRGLLSAAATALLPFLGLVFLAALTIGRRSAQPIENARRQLLAFTADASHELRTPLQVIEAETSVALRRRRDAPYYRATIERITAESARLRHLVDDLLWLARFDNQSIKIGGEPTDLALAADTAVQRFQSVATARGQTLRLTGTGERAPLVRLPEALADRLLGVLLDNACRYAPDGGTIEVSVGASDSAVQLRVDDSGPGIPLESRPAILGRFHRLAGDGSGSGLGLAIADAIVGATRGRWEIGDSQLGGASFAITWPVARPGSKPPQTAPLGP